MLLVVPSRERVKSLERLLKSFADTMVSCNVMVRLDEDDPCLNDYLELEYPDNVKTVVGEQVKMAGAMREGLHNFRDEDCYGFMGDDTLPKTPRWDEELRKSAGLWNVAYPDDLLKGRSLVTHPFIGGEFLRAVGFWALEGLTHLYTDMVWDYLGRTYGNLIYRNDVVVEHLHFSVGKSDFDKTYERTFKGYPYAEKDRLCFEKWKAQYVPSNTIRKQIAESAPAR